MPGAPWSDSCPSGSARSSGPRDSSASRRRRPANSPPATPRRVSRVRVARNGVDGRLLRAGRRPGGARKDAAALRGGTALPPVSRHARAPQERRDARRRLRAALVPATGRGPTSSSRADAGWKSGGLRERIARSPFRDRIHVAGYAPREAARELYRARGGLRLPVARGGVRSAAARGDGLRHAVRVLGRRRARRGGRRGGAPGARARRRGARPRDRARARGRRRCGGGCAPPDRPAPPRFAGRTPRAPPPTSSPRRRRGARERPGAAAPHRHRRAQGRRLRHRLLHPEPDRGDLAAAGGRALPLSRLRPRRRARSAAAAASSLRGRRGGFAGLLDRRADALRVAPAGATGSTSSTRRTT